MYPVFCIATFVSVSPWRLHHFHPSLPLVRWLGLWSCLANCYYADNRKERVQFDKITARVSRLCYGLDPDHIDASAITQKVISGVYKGVTTVELDNLVRVIIMVTIIGNVAQLRPSRPQKQQLT